MLVLQAPQILRLKEKKNNQFRLDPLIQSRDNPFLFTVTRPSVQTIAADYVGEPNALNSKYHLHPTTIIASMLTHLLASFTNFMVWSYA